VEHFLTEMDKIPGTFYAAKIRTKINSMLEGWNYRLDPAEYVKHYIKKVYNVDNSGPRGFGTETTGNSVFSKQKSDLGLNGGISEDMLADINSEEFKVPFKRQQSAHISSQISAKPSGTSFASGTESTNSAISTSTLLAQFDVEDDIAGLSVAGVTDVFKTKFITLRQHLEKMKDHPLMRII
jgi:hypothetical protein